MKGRTLLEEHRKQKKQVQRKLSEIQRLEARKTSLTIVNDGLPKGSEHYTMEDYMAEKEILEQELAILRRTERRLYDQIFSGLVRMASSREIDILWQRYIEDKNWARVETDLGVSHSYAMALHRSALVNFEKAVYST